MTTILITACVNPGEMINTKLIDSGIREKQYKDVLTFYLENTNMDIVFVENSNTDFSQDFMYYIDIGRLEYIAFAGNQICIDKGKGYGEANIIKYAFDTSNKIKEADYIIKITGRLKITNINHLLRYTNKVLKKNNKYIIAQISNKYDFVSTQFFVAHKEYFNKYLFNDIQQINEVKGIYLEHIVANNVKSWTNSHNKFRLFISPFKIEGVSGSTGDVYKNPNIKNYIYKALSVARFNFRYLLYDLGIIKTWY